MTVDSFIKAGWAEREQYLRPNDYQVSQAQSRLAHLGITLPSVPTIELNGPQTAEQLREALNQLEQAS